MEAPASLGWRMPAEWERHDATWLSWPKNPLTFPGDVLPGVESAYVQMITALSGGEKVKLLVEDEAAEARAVKMLERSGAVLGNVLFKRISSADVWIRDYGPTFLVGPEGKAATKWRFNAWGGKYDDLLRDDATGDEVVRDSGVHAFRPGIVMEGGSIDVNGAGRVMTTEQCLLNPNRNPQLSRRDIEDYLKAYINVDEVIWLKSGIDGDDTDGHVDDFARFVASNIAVCASSETGGHDPRVLRANLGILREVPSLEVIELPMPRPIPLPEEERNLPASYANFYIGNKVVLLPVFGDEADKGAIEIMGGCFPGREIVSIAGRDLVYGYGGVHCVTQQEPSAGRE